MKILPLFPELIQQLFREPATNKFPAKYLPPTVTEFLKDVGAGKTALIPPIPTPPAFRGKIVYQNDCCIGCGLCVKVCPSHAIELIPGTKQIRVWVGQCIFCSQCTSICPKGGLSMSDEFLLADENRYSENLIVE